MIYIIIEKGKTVSEKRTEAIIQLLTSFGCSVSLLQSLQQLSVAHVPALFVLRPPTLPLEEGVQGVREDAIALLLVDGPAPMLPYVDGPLDP